MTAGLIATNLTRRHRDLVAVDAVDLTVAPTARTALVGGSGSGKTTLLRVMSALDTPDTGSVTIDSVPVRPGSTRSLRWFRRRVQYIPQDPASSLHPRRSALELVATPLHRLGFDGDVRARARTALREVGLDDRFHRRRPSELSGGQNQRVAIARAIAIEPDYLLADEPVSGLDVELREQVLTVLDDLLVRTSAALLLITHDISVAARLCDTLAVMQDGRIVEYGSTTTVLASPDHHYTRMLLDAIPTIPS